MLFRNLSSANDRRALKLRERRLRRGAAVAVVATITALPTPAWALSGSEEGENTGVSAETVELDAITPEQLSALREKRQATSELTTRFRRVSGRNITTVAAPEPLTFKIPAARDMTIHGQEKSYTCGPASLKNMVKSMNKTFNGEYSSKSETTYKNWLGTTTDGTAIGSLVNVLNDKYGGGAGSIQNFGSWGLANPRDKWAYLAIIETDTGRYKQPVIQGVRTEHLPYWNNHSANHFNVAYGYNKATDPKKIYILEVYDRVKVYGAPYADGTNPYGHRQAPLAAAFEANDVSCPNCGDRRRIIQ